MTRASRARPVGGGVAGQRQRAGAAAGPGSLRAPSSRRRREATPRVISVLENGVCPSSRMLNFGKEMENGITQS